MLELQIDYREKELIAQINHILQAFPTFSSVFTLQTVNLPIGDIWFVDSKKQGEASPNTNTCVKVIIERKTIADLMSSIKDGRYDEQSLRLHAYPLHNHNIVYLIEGDATRFNVFKNPTQKRIFYSALTSISLYKGFSLMRTQGVEETAFFLCQMAAKIDKADQESKPFYYKTVLREEEGEASKLKGGCDDDDVEESGKLEGETTAYSQVIKTVKKDNITPENIGVIMLNQIPGVSHVTSAEIMGQYKTLKNLLTQLESNPNCLETTTIQGKNGKSRKVSKTVIGNIRRFLLVNL